MILRALSGKSSRPQEPWESSSRAAYVARGLVTNLLNPWILGFYLAMVPAFAGTGSRSAFLAAALVAGIHVAQLAAWHGLLVVTVSSVGEIHESRGRALRLAAGTGLLATGFWFLFR